MSTRASTVGIISIGDMGRGIAVLLKANGFPVFTSLEGRSDATRKRAEAAKIHVLETDVSLVEESDVILSIVPPRDAFATAKRILTAAASAKRKQEQPLYFLDLNAIAPASSRNTAEALQSSQNIRFIDGGIVGGPPRLRDQSQADNWYKPDIVVSGPHQLQELQPDGARVTSVLNMKHISPNIGSASGLKMCYASMTKGLSAIGVQVFTTAHALGVDAELKELLKDTAHGKMVQNGVTSCPPKAYRWIDEMREINKTHKEFYPDSLLFDEVAKIYQVMTDSELGKETVENRKRGTTTEDVAILMLEELKKPMNNGA